MILFDTDISDMRKWSLGCEHDLHPHLIASSVLTKDFVYVLKKR